MWPVSAFELDMLGLEGLLEEVIWGPEETRGRGPSMSRVPQREENGAGERISSCLPWGQLHSEG